MHFFDTQEKILKFLGHNIRDPTQSRSKFLHYFSLGVIISANFPMINYTINKTENLEEVAIILSMNMANFIGTANIVTYLTQRQLFKDYIERLEFLYKEFKPYDKNDYILTGNKYATKYVHVFQTMYFFSGIYYTFKPLPQMLWQKLRHQNVELILPYAMTLPFDTEHNIPNYIITYIYGAYICMVIVFYIPAIDGVFVGFMLNLRAHFKILQELIMNDQIDERKIAFYVKYHNELLEFTEQIGKLYRPVIFAQFLLTSITTGLLTLVILGNLTNLTIVLGNTTFLATKLLQLFVYCNCGEMVMQESLLVNEAVQCSNWGELKPKVRKSLLLIMLRSQRPLIIEAAFYKATLEKFMVIIQAASSFVTFMQSLE